MSHLKNPVSLLSFELGVGYDKRSSFIYGGPSSILLYTILHGFFTVLTMKELISILRSLVKGNGRKIRFNRILLWHMVENWEDLFKIIRLCVFPRRMHTFRSNYHHRRVPYNKLAWKRIVLSGIIAFFIFAMDIALISLSTATSEDFLHIDWDFKGEIPSMNYSNIIIRDFSNGISIRNRSDDTQFEQTPFVVWEKYRFGKMELDELFPTFKDVENPIFRCDTLRRKRWKVICQVDIGGEKYLYILRIEADTSYPGHRFNIFEIGNSMEFQGVRYKKAIEDHLNISITSFASTEDNFKIPLSSDGQCAGYSYVGDKNFTGLDCKHMQTKQRYSHATNNGMEAAFVIPDDTRINETLNEYPDGLDCVFKKKDCQSFLDSVSRDCKNRQCSVWTRPRCGEDCLFAGCGYTCDYIGFAMGSSSPIPKALGFRWSTDNNAIYRDEKCEAIRKMRGRPYYNMDTNSFGNCVETSDVIASIFLHSVRIGTSDLKMPAFESYGMTPFQSRGHLTFQRPMLPLYGIIIMYILLQLVSIILQTSVREHPICSEMKFLAEVCGANGVENLINVDLQDKEIVYSQSSSELDMHSGHCGYLPGRIAGDIRQFYRNKNVIESDNMNKIISESDIENVMDIDGCIGSDKKQNDGNLMKVNKQPLMKLINRLQE